MEANKELNKKLDKLLQKASNDNQGKKKKGKKKKGKGKKKKSQDFNGLSAGELRFRRKEMLTEVKGDLKGGAAALLPSESVMPFLGNLVKAFSEIKFHSLSFHWTPSVGTTKDGRVTLGFRPGVGATPLLDKVTSVAALVPSNSCAVWDKMSLVVPKDRLMSRTKYIVTSLDAADNSPGSLFWLCSGENEKFAGAIWVTYDVTLSGPRT
jgi:hypothetical protein